LIDTRTRKVSFVNAFTGVNGFVLGEQEMVMDSIVPLYEVG
jgi:hypothetical protein